MEKPESDRTSVTISKRSQRRLRKIKAVLDITHKEIVETAIEEYMKRRAGLDHILREEKE